jgi:lysophosphatidate acyltransferase
MFSRPISWIIGLKYHIRGKKHLEKDRACIIVANHQSSLDILGMFHLWPLMRKCAPVIKKEMLYIWPFGLSTWLGGGIFIDRSDTEKSISTLNNVIQDIKRKKVI